MVTSTSLYESFILEKSVDRLRELIPAIVSPRLKLLYVLHSNILFCGSRLNESESRICCWIGIHMWILTRRRSFSWQIFIKISSKKNLGSKNALQYSIPGDCFLDLCERCPLSKLSRSLQSNPALVIRNAGPANAIDSVANSWQTFPGEKFGHWGKKSTSLWCSLFEGILPLETNYLCL